MDMDLLDFFDRTKKEFHNHAWLHQFQGGAWQAFDWSTSSDNERMRGDAELAGKMSMMACMECPAPGDCSRAGAEEVCECVTSDDIFQSDSCQGWIASNVDRVQANIYNYLDEVFWNKPHVDMNILGDMADPWSSPNDPLFFSLHGYIDREFYMYQYVNFTLQER
jgi:hypothetical protein